MQRGLRDRPRRLWAEAVQQRRRLVEAVAGAAGAVRQPEEHSLALTERIKLRISQTTPQPPHSVSAEAAADERR